MKESTDEIQDLPLLLKAAKAMGYAVISVQHGRLNVFKDETSPQRKTSHWNPLTDKGDALDCAVKYDMMIDTLNRVVSGYASNINIDIDQDEPDRLKAVCRAIVLAMVETYENEGK